MSRSVKSRRIPSFGEGVALASFARHPCLGTWTHLITPEEVVEVYRRAIERGERILVGNVNLHCLYLSRYDVDVRSFFDRADLVYVDGMPVVWWLRLLRRPARRAHRATFVDWLPLLLARACDEGWRVYYLGSRPGVAEAMAEWFRARLPGLVLHTHHGYFDAERESAENAAVVADINAFRPHVLLVGMGTPREQRWLLENRARLEAQVVQYCGATADLVAGALPMPPRWLGRLGLEWLYRLATRPRDVWRRYLVEPWCLIGSAAADLRREYGPWRS